MGWIGIGILIGIGLMLAPLVICIGFAVIYGVLLVLLYAIPVVIGSVIGGLSSRALGIADPIGLTIGAGAGLVCSVWIYTRLNRKRQPTNQFLMHDDEFAPPQPSAEFRARLRRANQANLLLAIIWSAMCILIALIFGRDNDATIGLSVVLFVLGLPLLAIKMWFDPDLEKEQNRLLDKREAEQREQKFFRYK